MLHLMSAFDEFTFFGKQLEIVSKFTNRFKNGLKTLKQNGLRSWIITFTKGSNLDPGKPHFV